MNTNSAIIIVLIIIRPRRYAQHKMRPIAIDVAWSVCVCVCLLDTSMNPAKTDKTDQDAVWIVDSGGPNKPCIM